MAGISDDGWHVVIMSMQACGGKHKLEFRNTQRASGSNRQQCTDPREAWQADAHEV